MHGGQGVEHEMWAEVKVKPSPFRILAARLDVLVLRGRRDCVCKNWCRSSHSGTDADAELEDTEEGGRQ